MNLKKLSDYTEYELKKIETLNSKGDELYPGINGTVINPEVIPLRPINEIMSENTNSLVRGEDFDIDQVRDIENSLNSRLAGLRRGNRGMSREDLINFMAEMQLQDEAEENSEQ